MTLARLQLAVGSAAILDEERQPDGPRRVFTARAPDESPTDLPSRLVIWHPAAPDGPLQGTLLDRMASIRSLGHPALAALLAVGPIDDAAWVIEPAPKAMTLAARLASGGPLPQQEVTRLLREVARALTSMHRRGICHGALTTEAITLRGNGVKLHRLGRRVDGTVADDLAALAVIGRAATEFDPSRGGSRRVIPTALADLLDWLDDEDPARRPSSASEILVALDAFPGAPTDSSDLFEGSGMRGRAPGERRTAMLLAAVAVLLVTVWFLFRTT